MAALSLAAELSGPDTKVGKANKEGDLDGLRSALKEACDKLAKARPTAVNLMKACDDIKGTRGPNRSL